MERGGCTAIFGIACLLDSSRILVEECTDFGWIAHAFWMRCGARILGVGRRAERAVGPSTPCRLRETMVTASRALNTMLRMASLDSIGAKKMHRDITLGLALIGAGIVAAYVVSPPVTGPAEHDTLSRQAPMPSHRNPGAVASSDQPQVIISVPQRSAPQDAEVRGEEPPRLFSLPSDRAGLASALQRELQRVGCYDREINGVWTTSSCMAMQTFLGRVNAALPFDEPDVILLSLVQAHKGTACGSSCPTGKGATHSEQCWPNPLRSAKFEPDERVADALNPLTTGTLPAGTTSPQPPLRTTRAPASVGPEVGTIASEPPKLVRKILRTFQRGIAQLGFR